MHPMNLLCKVAISALALLGLVGCSATEHGSAEPRVESSQQQKSSGSVEPAPGESLSLSVDPCELLSVEELKPHGEFIDAGRRELGGARSCVYQRSARGGHQGFVVALNVRDSQGIESVADAGGKVTESAVGERNAVQSANMSVGDCTVAMEIDDSSRIDVSVNGLPSVDVTCPIAEDVARLVEPRLPDVPS
ncbi:Protein of unknown function (DUF3558) [Saccharomonospora xinjiangensis XJ-54]|uniref:DUF3558 domain-containing protein n=2 Tax=Saccharomonospora TaxID=1851 RepID=I0V0T4_9PSEU|nr:Protein of unknown function (DUF3558) [Saccharomonospora xinjiangensis XJ-54]